MIFSGHSRSLHLLRSSSDDSLATSQDAEAKQQDRRYTSPEADTRFRTEKATPWFAGKACDKAPSNTESSMPNEWPNGPPPSGPRSQRIAISPPSIRHSSNGNEHVRRLSDHDNTVSFARQSFPSSVQWRRIEALPTVSRGVENGSDLMAVHVSVSAEDIINAVPDPEIMISASTMASANHSSDNDRPTTSALTREALWAVEQDESEIPMLKRDSDSQPDNFSIHPGAAETPQLEHIFRVNSLTHLSQPQPNQQSAHLDEIASVASDVTMSNGPAVSGRSSMTSGSRTGTCHKCKKTAQATSPLFKCSECPRRYHHHCAVPRIPSSSQASGALDWICKHCVKDFREKDVLATGPPGISRNFADKIDLPSESAAIGQRGTKTGMTVSFTQYKGLHNMEIGGIKERSALAEAPSNGHPYAPADSDSGQATRNFSNHNVPSSIKHSEGSDNSAFQLNGRISEARKIKDESMGNVLSTPALNSSNSPLPQASAEQDWSIHNIHSPPHIRTETNPHESHIKAVTIRQPTSFKPAAANGFGPSFDETCMQARHHTSRFELDTENSEDDALSTSPEKSRDKVRSTSHATTAAGRLQQPHEAILSKLEIQSSKKSLKHLTCYHWKQRGGCRYREDECQYAHYETGMDEGKNTTCFWWWSNGHCKKSERECLYAHRDTGLYAKPPPGFVPQKRLYMPPRSPDRIYKNSRANHYSPLLSPKETRRSPTDDLSTRRSPPLRPAALSSSIPESSWDRPPMSNTDGAAINKAEQKVISVDPRLSRRPSSMSVDNSETSLTISKTDMNIASTPVPKDPVTPRHGSTAVTEPASSFSKCQTCDKKVFGSASLCFTCKGTKLGMSKALMKSSPFIPETPEVDTQMTPEVGDQTAHVMPPTSPDKPAPQTANSLKRMHSVLGPGIDTSLFIKKKARIFKPSEPRRASADISPQQMDSPSLKEKPVFLPRPNVAVGGNLTKTPVPLEDLIELERLRKQVAHLETLNVEEKKAAYDEAQRWRAEEKTRADKLSEELEALKVRNREMMKSNQEEQKRAAAQLTQSKKEQSSGIQDDAARTPQLARRSKAHPSHIRRQSLNDFDRASDASIQSPVRQRAMRIEKEETKLLRDMKERGVVFESDDESDDGPDVPPPTPFKPPKDPLWHAPKSSRDLFEVAPQYQQENLLIDFEAKKKEIAARPSRKQTFGRVLVLSDRELGTANVHREVDRCLPSRMVRTRVADASGYSDPFTETEQTKEVDMTFEEFLGVPENAVLCRTTTQQLAYRDGALDRWGKLPRVPDDEKFEIGV